jgi:putative endonuclease
MKYYVYLLITISKKKIISYVGYTIDIKNRLKLHNASKGAKFTKGRKWILIYKKEYKSKSEALKQEYKLKKNYKKRKEIKIKFLNK